MKTDQIEAFKKEFEEELKRRLLEQLGSAVKRQVQEHQRVVLCTEALRTSISASQAILANQGDNPELNLQVIEDDFFARITDFATKNRSNPREGLPHSVAWAAKEAFTNAIRRYLPVRVKPAAPEIKVQADQAQPLVRQIFEMMDEREKKETARKERVAALLQREERSNNGDFNALSVEDRRELFRMRESSFDAVRVAASAAVVDKLRRHYRSIGVYVDSAYVDRTLTTIQDIILTEIIRDPHECSSIGEAVGTWLGAHKQILLDKTHVRHPAVLIESRRYLNNGGSVKQSAWRNFDPDAPIQGSYPCYFSGHRQIPAVREALTLYYIAITDPAQVPESVNKVKFINQLIGQLNDIRRAHIDDDRLQYSRDPSKCIDRPSCAPGNLTRIGAIGEGHPIAEVRMRPEMVAGLILSEINDGAERFFKSLPNGATKVKALESLENISSANAQKILSEEEDFSDDMPLREEAIRHFGLFFNAVTEKYEVNPAVINRVNDALNRDATDRGENFQPLTPEERSDILCYLLNPVGRDVYHEAVKNQFKASLTLAERADYESPTGQVRTLARAYQALLEQEAADAQNAFDVLVESDKDAVSGFKAFYAPRVVTDRIAEKLIQEGTFGNQEAVVRGIAAIKKTNLLSNYITQSVLQHAQNTTQTYHMKQSFALDNVLNASRVDWQYLKRLDDTEKERSDVRESLIDELTFLVLDGPDSLQLLPFIPGYSKEAEIRELGNFKKKSFVKQMMRNGAFRQSLDVNNTGPSGSESGVEGDQIGYPRIPVIHPYRINEIPIFSIAMAGPRGTISNLPAGVLKQLTEHNIGLNNFESFWLVQNMPRQGVGAQPLLLRPNPWLHPDAPRERGEIQNSNILVSICDVGSRMPSVTPIPNVSTQPDVNGHMGYTSNQMPILGIDNRPESHSFYSLCIDPATGRAALTLHWLLDEMDYQQLLMFVNNWDNPSVEDLLGFLPGLLAEHSALNNPLAFSTLEALVAGNQPTPDSRMARYRLGEAANNSSNLQLAEALFSAKGFSNEPNVERRRQLLLNAMQEAQFAQNPPSLAPGDPRKPVSDEQQQQYFQLLLKAYLEVSTSPAELERLKKVGDEREQKEEAEAPESTRVVIHLSAADAAAQKRADEQQRAREDKKAREEKARQEAAVARQEVTALARAATAAARRETARQAALATAAAARAARGAGGAGPSLR